MLNNKKTNNDDNPCCIKFWEIHATACELISFSMRYPSQTLYEAVSTGEWKEAVCEMWTLLDLEISDDFMADLTNAQKVDYHDLRVEATELFVCHPSAKCSPYETHWRSEGKKHSATHVCKSLQYGCRTFLPFMRANAVKGMDKRAA